MTALKSIDTRNKFKKVNGTEIEKARKNAEYLAMVKESRQQLAEGKTYTFTTDDLLAMEDMTFAEMQAFAELHKDF